MPSNPRRGVAEQAPATEPQFDCGTFGQRAFEWPVLVGELADHVGPINEVIAAVVEDYFGGVVAFAARIEQPAPTVSRRLRRADDGKGQRLELPTTYIAEIWRDPAARVVLLDRLCALAGRKPTEPVLNLTTEDKLRAVRELVNDRALRLREREMGLPAGSLEP